MSWQPIQLIAYFRAGVLIYFFDYVNFFFFNNIIIFVLTAELVPEIDLAFAISTTATNAATTFARMRETVKSVIDMYGTEKIRYALLLFGSATSRSISFSEKYPEDDLKNILNVVRPVSGDPDLSQVLERARRLFQTAPPRPMAKKVLVVIIDKKSINRPDELKIASKPLHKDKIKVSLL